MFKKPKYLDQAASFDPMLSNSTHLPQPPSTDFVSPATVKRDRFDRINKQLRAYSNMGKMQTKIKV